MIATVSGKGRVMIPAAIREQAKLKADDRLDVGYAHGLIVLRKRRPMTPARVRSLILSGRDLPKITSKDETTVADVVRRVCSRRKS